MASVRKLVDDALAILAPGLKDGIPMPLLTFHLLMKILSTYALKLWVKWGKHCNHYLKVWDLLVILDYKPVTQAADEFSLLLYALVFYDMCDNARQHFYQAVHPNKFKREGGPHFPQSTSTRVNVHVLKQQGMTPLPKFPG